MFESVVSSFLSSYLGAYIEYDPSKLTLGLWDGKIDLQNVKLKK
jgi:hypothetical protein